MRRIKLAWRMVTHVRKRYRLSSVALTIIAALVMCGFSLLSSVQASLAAGLRIGDLGELRMIAAAEEAREAEQTVLGVRQSPAILTCARRSTPAYAALDDWRTPVTLTVANLEDEALFRSIRISSVENGQVPALIVASPSARIARGQLIRIDAAGGSETVVVAGTAATWLDTVEIIVDPSAGDRLLAESDADRYTVLVRGGGRPIGRSAMRSLLAAGFESTGWRQIASRRLLGGSAGFIGTVGGAAAIALFVVVPALMLFARQQRRHLVLLRTWGFSPSEVRAVIRWISMIGCLVPVALGAAIGAAVLGVLDIRGGGEVLLRWVLSGDALASFAPALRATATGLLATIALGVLFGGVGALPMVRVVDRIIAGTDR